MAPQTQPHPLVFSRTGSTGPAAELATGRLVTVNWPFCRLVPEILTCGLQWNHCGYSLVSAAAGVKLACRQSPGNVLAVTRLPEVTNMICVKTVPPVTGGANSGGCGWNGKPQANLLGGAID